MTVTGALPTAVTPFLFEHTAVTTYWPGAVPAPKTAAVLAMPTGVIALGGTPVAFQVHVLILLPSLKLAVNICVAPCGTLAEGGVSVRVGPWAIAVIVIVANRQNNRVSLFIT